VKEFSESLEVVDEKSDDVGPDEHFVRLTMTGSLKQASLGTSWHFS